MRAYLDYSATTPVKKEVFEAMLPFLTEVFGNPSSIHSFGREAKKAIEDSRGIIADFFGAKAGEIVFTSGATEANNLAILGLVGSFVKPHIITSQIEHHAVIHTCQYLEKKGLADVTYLKP